MRRLLCHRYYILLVIGFANSSIADTSVSVSESSVPDWVSIQKVKAVSNPAKLAEGSGTYYSLVDNQINLEQQEYFTHFTLTVINEKGVEDNGELSISFSPRHQTLTFHYINIIRGGRIIESLDVDSIRLIQQEEQMSSHMYNESYNALIFLKNLRVGDVLDYAFTKKGDNPVYSKFFFYSFKFGWGVNVGKLYTRVLCPPKRKLRITEIVSKLPYTKRRIANGDIEYLWKLDQIKAIQADSKIPGWYFAYPEVQISEFQDWASVVNWARPLYHVASVNTSMKLNSLIKSIKAESSKPKKQVLKALRYVQDDVRYLGIEVGANSIKPHNPEFVLNHLYGDCKDKSYLLAHVLQGLGIQSYPILVNSNGIAGSEIQLPSPDIFNHCVIMVVLEGKNYYLDPTLSFQGGTLDSAHFPFYQKGLIIRKGEVKLRELPLNNQANSHIEFNEIFIIKKDNKTVELRVESVYYGSKADYQREYFADTNLETVSKTYLNYYATEYKNVEKMKDLKISDDRIKNIFKVFEYYRIQNMQTMNDKKTEVQWDFYPLLINDYILKIKSPIRNMPYKHRYPLDVKQTIRIDLTDRDEDWDIEDDHVDIKNPAFSYIHDVQFKDKIIIINYQYKSRKATVDADQSASFNKAIDDVVKTFNYGIYAELKDAGTFGEGLFSDARLSDSMKKFMKDNGSQYFILSLALIFILLIIVFILSMVVLSLLNKRQNH
ncbi:DUF3857 domain-containing protein [bacterium AH-315-E10]|nr:DUF3857 domain-containing protein [bacterium AH-315-E10]